MVCTALGALLNWMQHDADTLTLTKLVFIKVCRLFLYWQWLWLSTVLGSYPGITAFWNPWLCVKELWLKFWLFSRDYWCLLRLEFPGCYWDWVVWQPLVLSCQYQWHSPGESDFCIETWELKAVTKLTRSPGFLMWLPSYNGNVPKA